MSTPFSFRMCACVSAFFGFTGIASAQGEDASSPLQVIIDGREAARDSILTETGMSALSQNAANVVMYSFGAIAVFCTAVGLWELYKASEGDTFMGGRASKESAFWKIGIAGAMSIPAIIAGLFPHVVLGTP